MIKEWMKKFTGLFNWPLFWIMTAGLTGYLVLRIVFSGPYLLTQIMVILVLAFAGAKHFKLDKESIMKSIRSVILSAFFVAAIFIALCQY